MPSSRRTRIVATLGPATDPPGILQGLLKAGVNVARINFSHGSAEDHLRRIAELRQAAGGLKSPIAVLADLPGPKLRVLLPAARDLRLGDSLAFSTLAHPIASDDVTITEPELLRDVSPGHRVLLDDGRLQLEVVKVDGDRLLTRVTVGGTLLPHKGVNLPDTQLSAPALTDRDLEAIAVAARGGVDWLALSFVRSAEAALELRIEAEKHGLDVPVLAKMERPEAVERAEEIVQAFNGIMVARGDLGVEIPLERVPTVQKKLIATSRKYGKPVITATDMLDSMRNNPRPTRAEASDVANAIYDGTDAIMLSGETAVGKYPVESVSCMHRIALEAEKSLQQEVPLAMSAKDIDDSITQIVVEVAYKIDADAIITPTLSGRTARLVARHRPRTAIIAPTPKVEVLRQMALIWGVQPVLMDYGRHLGDDRINGALRTAYEAGAVKVGQRVIVLAGHPIEGGEHLPTIRFLRVAEGGQAAEPA